VLWHWSQLRGAVAVAAAAPASEAMTLTAAALGTNYV